MDAVIARMMATNPADRYATPQTVMRALLPFLRSGSGEIPYLSPQDSSGVVSASQCRVTPPSSAKRRVLIVDDERMMRAFARSALECDGLECEEAEDGMVALELIHARPFDLVLLDMEMPMLPGDELLRRLRSDPASPNLKVILASGRSTVDEMAAMLSTGADDFLAKPFGVVQLMSRVKAALRLKESQDRADALAQSQRGVNEQLEQSVRSRDSDVVNARNALTLAVAELVAFRGFETSAHLVRMQKYVHTLAQEAAACPAYAAKIDEQFLHLLESTAPLHDVGMIGLPDQVLLKPGKLTDEERILMRTHTTIGADILQRICRQRGFSDAFLQMAIDVTRHHHERWDGKGYPDHLAGEDIPLAARCVCIADVYDALRSRRPHKPALSHAAALAVMTETSHGQFDPMLLTIFQKCAGKIEAVFKSNPD
jgi:putative two-component system response regulator